MEEIQKSRVLIAVCSLLSAAAGAGGALMMLHAERTDRLECLAMGGILGLGIGFSSARFKPEKPAWEGSIAVAALMTVSVIVSAAVGMAFTFWRDFTSP